MMHAKLTGRVLQLLTALKTVSHAPQLDARKQLRFGHIAHALYSSQEPEQVMHELPNNLFTHRRALYQNAQLNVKKPTDTASLPHVQSPVVEGGMFPV